MSCNVLEWYDFTIYGILVAYISQAVLPPGDANAALLSTLAIFGVGFLLRPIGGLVLGGVSDRYGRKPVLVIAASLMAVGTMLIGLVPTYDAIGMAAPVLLLLARLLQGFSAGGEFGVANSFLAEWAPQGRRGFWTSWLSTTVALGSAFASGIAAVLITLLSPTDMASWGWRVPFLLGGVLGLLALWLRVGIEETPNYREAGNTRTARYDSRENLRSGLIVFGITLHWTVCYYMFLIYMPIYARAHAGLSSAQSVWSNTFCTAVIVCLVPVVGLLSDRYGRRPFLAASCTLVFLLTAPLFWVVATLDSLPVVIAVQALFGIAIALYSGAAPAVVAELFSIHSRSRWSSVAYALAAAVFGSFAPFIAVKLATRIGFLAPTAYVMVAALVSCLVVLRMPETGRKAFV